MFTPKSGTGFPSSASGRALASGRRRTSVGLAGSRSTPRSPYATPSGRNTPTLGTPGSSALSQFSVESFGSALPALVKEALTFSEKNCEMSAVISSCGWAWLVVGRRLLVWRYTAAGVAWRGGRGGARTEFRELLLPQSDLAHRAQLVVLRQPDPAQLPSCMTVSPEGSVRYWHSIAHESSYTEVSTELQGQECDSLVYLSGRLGYFLTTTTSTCLLLLPSPSPRSGEPGVSVRLVKSPAGLLGGLSRRVTSLVFGSLPTQAPEARLVRVVCRGSGADNVEVLVLSAEHLQCWQLTAGTSTDVLLYQASLLQILKQALAAKTTSLSAATPSAVGGTPTSAASAATKGVSGVWLLDAQPQPYAPSRLVVLLASLCPTRGSELTLALAVVESTSCPEGVLSLTVVQHTEAPPLDALGGGDDTTPPPALLQYRLLIAASTAFIHTPSTVIAVPCSDATIALACKVPLPSAGDRLLGAGRLKGRALFFAASQGIVAVSPPGSSCASPAGELDYHRVAEESEDTPTLPLPLSGPPSPGTDGGASARLREAFLLYSRDDLAAAQALLEGEFPHGGGAQLPEAVLGLSKKILDDTPATDPRWAEAGGGVGAHGTTLSLIITNQIRDKITAHKYYVCFLQQTGLWTQLGSSESTRTSLLENAQRLAFAATLRARHQHHQLLVDHAIEEVVRDRGVPVTGRLTPSDVFYCRVSAVYEIVWGLMVAVRQVVDADVVPRDAPATLHTTAALLLQLVKAATSVTSAGGASASSSYAPVPPKHDYVPWTASEGPKGIRTLLVQLHGYLVDVGIARAEEAATRSSLYATLVELTDVILAGYQPQLSSLLSPGHDSSGAPVGAARFEGSFSSGGPLRFPREGNTVGSAQAPLDPSTSHHSERYQLLLGEYQKLRYSLISPLASGGQQSQALSLAEKYCDFRTLVEVCDASDDSARLNRYMVQFGAQGFSDFVFRWFLETGKRGRLLSYGGETGGRTGEGAGEWATHLSSFLKGYSGLEWLHQLGTRDFSAAQQTLQRQALAETTYLARKKTLASLSKLCRIAAGTSKEPQEDSEDSEVPQAADGPQGATDPLLLEEELIMYQEQLPPHVLAAQNLELDTMRVLSPSEIIQLYTSEDNTGATELDFKRALELLPFVPSLEESEELKLSIWVRAVLRDTWSSLSTDAPLDAISSTLLFRTIELAYTQGCPLQEMLVPVDELLAVEELQPLCEDPGFPFLIRAGYEKIEQLVGAVA